MTKPPFRLQTLLTLKANLVEARELELSELRAAQEREEERLMTLETARQERQDRLRQQSQGNLNVSDLSYHCALLEQMDHAITAQAKVVQAARQRVEEKRAELITLLQEKKVLEKLKEKADSEWAQRVARAEAKFMDELSTTRYGRARAGYEVLGSIGK